MSSAPNKIAFILGAIFFAPIPTLLGQRMSANSDAPEGKSLVQYETVQPIFRKHCASCHNEDQPRGDFSVSSLEKILAGSSSGPVVVPGNIGESPLYLVTAHLNNPKMPPNKPRIPASELKQIERWIQSGLVLEAKPQSLQSTDSKPRNNVEMDKTAASVLDFPGGMSPIKELLYAAPVRAIASHPSQPIAAVAGAQQVVLIDIHNQKLLDQAISIGTKEATSLAFSPDGLCLFIAAGVPGESGSVLQWDLSKRAFVKSFANDDDVFQAMASSKDGSYLAVGTTSRTVELYGVPNNVKQATFSKHTDWILALSASPDGLLMASGDRFGSIQIWETSSGKEFTTLRGHASAVIDLDWSTDGNQLVSASWDGTIRVWDLHSQQEIGQWDAHEKGVLAMQAFSCGLQDVGNLISVGRDGRVVLWDRNTHQLVAEVELEDEAIAVEQICSESVPSWLVCDASGRIHFVSMQEKALRITNTISLPTTTDRRAFISVRPVPLERKNLPSQLPATAASNTPTEPLMPADESKPTTGAIGSGVSLTNEQSDLMDSMRALESVELSLKSAYATVYELEQSVGRLKQVIAIQEARIKQRELEARKSKSK